MKASELQEQNKFEQRSIHKIKKTSYINEINSFAQIEKIIADPVYELISSDENDSQNNDINNQLKQEIAAETIAAKAMAESADNTSTNDFFNNPEIQPTINRIMWVNSIWTLNPLNQIDIIDHHHDVANVTPIKFKRTDDDTNYGLTVSDPRTAPSSNMSMMNISALDRVYIASIGVEQDPVDYYHADHSIVESTVTTRISNKQYTASVLHRQRSELQSRLLFNMYGHVVDHRTQSYSTHYLTANRYQRQAHIESRD